MDCLGLNELPMHYKLDMVHGIVGVAQGFFFYLNMKKELTFKSKYNKMNWFFDI